jgi:hypothetical protein
MKDFYKNLTQKYNPVFTSLFLIMLATLIFELIPYLRYEGPHRPYLISSHAGLIRGAGAGYILGSAGIISAINQGAVFAIINPAMKLAGY